MNKKKVILGASLLAFSALFVLSCGKRKPNVAPEPDTELQSSIDAAWATFVITELDAQCGFMGEDAGLSHFYTAVPGTEFTGTNSATQGSMTITRDPADERITMSFNKTSCVDGRYRDGSLSMRYKIDPTIFTNPVQQQGNIYTKDYSFASVVDLFEYKLDGWLITTLPGTSATLRNTVANANYDPATVKLTWTFTGKFKFQHPTDTSKNIIWSGTLKKTLTNSTDKKVFKATANHKTDSLINWRKGVVSYEVNATGFTSRTIPFTIEVTSANPLIRDYSCTPDRVADVTLNGTTPVTRFDTFHPISSGIMSFTTGTQYPRQVYFGSEGHSGSPLQCDNTGEVLIKGNLYRIDFKK